MKKGWVKLHRKLLDNAELASDPKAKFIFLHLLMLANPKGQVLTTIEELAELTGEIKSTAFRATKRLEKYGITQRQTQHRKSLITICSWRDYQSSTQQEVKFPRNTDATPTQRPPLSVRNENKNKEREVDYFKSREKAEQVRQKLKEQGILK